MEDENRTGSSSRGGSGTNEFVSAYSIPTVYSCDSISLFSSVITLYFHSYFFFESFASFSRVCLIIINDDGYQVLTCVYGFF